MAINPIIFSDQGGIGVQVGDERVYIGDDLMQALNADYTGLQARNRALDSDNIQLREKLSDTKEMQLKYGMIQSLVSEGGC